MSAPAKPSFDERAEELARSLLALPEIIDWNEYGHSSRVSAFVEVLREPCAALLQAEEALAAYTECGQFKTILQHGRGTQEAVNAEKKGVAALTTIRALVGGEDGR